MFAELDPKIINLTPQQLVRKVDQPQAFRKLQLYSKRRMLAQSRSVYKNRQTRDINRFMRELNDFNRKMDAKQANKSKNESNLTKNTKKYDENPHLQLQFHVPERCASRIKTEPSQKEKKYTRRIDKFNEIPSTSISQFSKRLFKKPSLLDRRLNFPALERKSASIGVSDNKAFSLYQNINIAQSYSKLSPGWIRKTTTLSPRKKGSSRLFSEKLMEISLEKMEKIYKHLQITLYGNFKQERVPESQKLNRKIIDRYHLRLNFEGSGEQHNFQLPYCIFSNKKAVEHSIRQIVNMSGDKTLKIAFNIYDKNKNGAIDQKDLLQLIKLTDQLPHLQQDLNLMIRNCILQDKLQQRSNFFLHNKLFQPSMQSLDLDEVPSPILKAISVDEKSIVDPDKKGYGVTSFKKGKWFCFMGTQEHSSQNQQKQSLSNLKVVITWPQFKQIFGYHRPAIFYDMIKFLFNCQTEHFRFPLKKRVERTERVGSWKGYTIGEIINKMEEMGRRKVQVVQY